MTDPGSLLMALLASPSGRIGGMMLLVLAVAVVWTRVTARNGRRAARRRLRVSDAVMPSPAPDSRKTDSSAPGEGLVLEMPRRRGSVLLDQIVARATQVTAHLDAGTLKLARQRLMQAGYFDPNAVPLFFAARVAGAAILPLTAVGLTWWLETDLPRLTFLSMLIFAGIFGYLLPSLYVGRRTTAVLRENRIAFPDFMDLMGVCANAGLSMEAGLERVSRELAPMYPTLGVNLQILCLEVRAGRPIEIALQTMADRLNVPEVRAFATLLQQSKELGSSLSDALRVFSEDMRHQRLAAAEEKAYALPAKLSVPVSACILPVVLFIAIWPVVVHFKG